MSKPRKKPNTRFHAFIVEPSPDFEPTNWQQTPRHYRIVSYVGPKDFRGSADAWKFLYNHDALSRGDQSRWAICLDFDAPILKQRAQNIEDQLPEPRRPAEGIECPTARVPRLPASYQTPNSTAATTT